MKIEEIFFKKPPPKRKSIDDLPLTNTPNYKVQKLISKDSRDHVHEEVEEEDERFFGDGLGDHDRDVLDIINEADNIEIEDFNLAELKKLVSRLDKSYNLNLDLRARYPTDPTKFIQSEVDLDSDIRSLSILATDPTLYLDAVQLNLPASFIQLLTHENVDIALATVDVLTELLDDDVINPAAGLESTVLDGIHDFVNSLLDLNLLEVLEVGLRQEEMLSLDQDQESIIKFLALLDALLAADVSMPSRFVKTQLIPILVDFVRPNTYSPLSAYAIELLAVLSQNSISARTAITVDHGGMDVLLKSIAKYRKRDPVDEDETEYLANAFDILYSCLSAPQVQKTFRELEGLELMVMLVNARRLSRTRAIRVINLATLPIYAEDIPGSEIESIRNAVHFVSQAQGLSCIFPVFMQQDYHKLKRKYSDFFNPILDEEHVVSILVNLFRCFHFHNVAGNDEFNASVPTILERVVNKFNESNRAKLVHLASRFAYYWEIVGTQSDNYLSRLDAGLYTLTQLSVLLCFVMKCSSECTECIVGALLPATNNSLEHIKLVVSEYLENADSPVASELNHILI